MAAMIKCDLGNFWRQKELERGRIITVAEVAKATGISHDAVSRLKHGGTTRFDSPVLGKICRFFDVPNGQTIPFLKVHYNGEVA